MTGIERATRLVAGLRQYHAVDILAAWQGISSPFTPDQLQVNLVQSWQLPGSINALRLERVTVRLSLTWWAELAEVWVNGQRVRVGDLFDQKCCVILGAELNPGVVFDLEVRLWKPKHDCLAFPRAEILIEYPFAPCDPGKLATEMEVVAICLPVLGRENPSLNQVFDHFLDRLVSFGVDSFGLSDLGRLAEIRRDLLGFEEYLKRRKIYILGNSHIDIAWLWPIAETKEVMVNTFGSVLALQDSYPELVFNQSSALAYRWMEEEFPPLFAQIKAAIATNRWEPVGGMWVEPDGNLPSGESLIRQIWYGKGYFESKFERDVQIAWLPDTFGFNYQLPQILLKSGFKAFITQKLSWNDTHKFPYHVFHWQGLDGSRILTYFCNRLGMGIEPVAIAQYLADQNPQVDQVLWLYGVGDHGGGVTSDMLDVSREWQRSPLFFDLIPSTAANFIQQLDSQTLDLPVWADELYLEFHRGTYTSKADQKWQNRKTEIALINLEKFYATAAVFDPFIYPYSQLDRAWQLLLTNQFHDILPGTSVPRVFADADQGWQEITQISQALLAPWQQDLSPRQFCLCNLLNWPRRGLVELPKSSFDSKVDWSSFGGVVGANQVWVPLQETETAILFDGGEFCGLSAKEFRLTEARAASAKAHLKITKSAQHIFTLENQYLTVSVSAQSGEIVAIYDRRYQVQILGGASEWQFFQDHGQYWDAWNIDPDYESHRLESATLESITIKEWGELRVSLEIHLRFRNSSIVQQYQLDALTPALTSKVEVDWQEQQMLVKLSFPVSFEAEFATYEIPMGAIARSTQDRAKFEVPAQFWADLSGAGVGLAIANDCKYGYSAKPNSISLTVLRSPQWPCPDSDRGRHCFSYQLIPHQGNWQEAGIVQAAHEFNTCLWLLSGAGHFTRESFLNSSATNIVVSAFKRSPQGLWILRCYEAAGITVDAEFSLRVHLTRLMSLDLMERPLAELDHHYHGFRSKFQPFEIKTFGLELVALAPDSAKSKFISQ